MGLIKIFFFLLLLVVVVVQRAWKGNDTAGKGIEKYWNKCPESGVRTETSAQAAFTPLLDEPLIVAIAHDHDLDKDSEYDAAYTILQGLAQDVAVEEATGFNPSGLSASAEDMEDTGNDAFSAVTDSLSQKTSQTHVTEPSSTGTSPVVGGPSLPRLTTFNNDSEESKIVQLRGLFAELKEYDVKHALKKANGDFQTALDDLLNVQYLQSTGQLTKGLDGFFQPDEAPRVKKKGKRGGKGKKSISDVPTSPTLDINLHDDTKVSKHQDDIAFITDRMDVSYNEVSEIYYRKKCSAGATVAEVIDRYIEHGIHTHDEEGKKFAQELAQKYRLVPERYMATIVQVAGPIRQFSDDLASLLNKHFAKHPWTERLDLSYRLTPLPHGEIDNSLTAVTNKTAAMKLKSPVVSPVSPTAPARYSDFSQAVQMSNQYNQARREATASASQLFKRGGSNPLYRQGAVYYSEQARELGRRAQQATSTAADLLVEQQSTSRSIDLHGVYVHDGVRIARQKVQEWWQSLGEYRTREARTQPFTVVTGLGRHSAGGVSQLRQAVAAALLQDGWRMQIETGRFVVNGRR
ncbi:hypothetical protein B0I35DRAFT_480673 [Stachybotrys elegans]|uniref:Smr domain-containing protein n=1 Tax=Stachybotrys elegans TaxID=80388 RepID=A0A8K0SM27_9HYPO|nr:hypothetical protein B0I35DRAFT_480673 [Stachybotrys elegans]